MLASPRVMVRRNMIETSLELSRDNGSAGCLAREEGRLAAVLVKFAMLCNRAKGTLGASWGLAAAGLLLAVFKDA